MEEKDKHGAREKKGGEAKTVAPGMGSGTLQRKVLGGGVVGRVEWTEGWPKARRQFREVIWGKEKHRVQAQAHVTAKKIHTCSKHVMAPDWTKLLER